MRVSYLMTAAPPPLPGTDAVVREGEWLCSKFGGEVHFLFPFSRPHPYFPRALYGFQSLRRLRELDRRVDLHHVFHAELYPFPVLRWLKKPIVYSVVSGVSGRSVRKVARIVVPSRADLERLKERGLTTGELMLPAVDTSRFHQTPPPTGEDFILLSGSAPWTRKQFRTKGVDALLSVARETSCLRLVLLWRGLLRDELERRVRAYGLTERVEVIDERVDVSAVMARVHAAVALAEKQKLVKAFPDSLMEALVCARPVLVSDCLAMSDFVSENACGQVVRGADATDLAAKLGRLRRDYDLHQGNALGVGRRSFSMEDRIPAYRKLYEAVVSGEL